MKPQSPLPPLSLITNRNTDAIDGISVQVYMDAMSHADFWDRLAAWITKHGWPEHGNVINLYPEIPRDENGWEEKGTTWLENR